MPTTTGVETVTLKGGIVVSLDALQLAWRLEEHGFLIYLADDGALLVKPGSRLSTEDDLAIRQHKGELIALVKYVETIQ